MQPFNALKRLFTSSGSPDFAVSSLSACGLVRRENQDSVVNMPEHGLFAVADGMGGGEDGQKASAWIKEALENAAPALALESSAEAAAKVDEVLQAVNARIRAYAKAQGHKSMGSTAAIMLFAPSHTRALALHIGDSRIYRLRGGVLECITQDHTVGVEMSRKTLSRREAAELASRKNPLTHILTRAVGTEFRVRAQWQELEIKARESYLICTDGVHDMLRDDAILSVLKRRLPPAGMVQALSSQVLESGARDNYSMIALTITKGK